MERALALVVDGDPGVRALVRDALEGRGMMTLGAPTAHEAFEVVRTQALRVLIADLDAPGVSASQLLESARQIRPSLVVVALAGPGAGDRARSAVEAGAYDVVFKPLDEVALQLLALRTLAHSELLDEHQRLREELRGRTGYGRVVGRSAAMERLRERLERAAATDVHVMITGEEGAGKELAARALHSLSERRDGPFLAVDCKSLPPGSLESELFGQPLEAGGVEPGAGLIASAGGGIVFLDGVLGLTDGLQQRLLDVTRDSLSVNVRFLSATAGDVDRAVEQGRLREDLVRHLSATTIHVPPLRERADDIPLLTRHFIQSIREINNLPPIHLAPDSLSLLEHHDWPGNVRELRNAVEQAVILAVDGMIRPRDLPDRVRRAATAEPQRREGFASSTDAFKDAKRAVVDSFEKGYLVELLERHRGNVTAAAQQAGMLRSALQRLLRKHRIRSADFRRARDHGESG